MQNNHLVVGASDLSYGTFQCKKFQLPMMDNKSSTRLPYAEFQLNSFLKVIQNKE